MTSNVEIQNAQVTPHPRVVKRISNPATLWLQIAWPIFGFALLVYAVIEIQAGSASAPQLVTLVAAAVIWRRFFGAGDAYEVLEGDAALIVKRARLSQDVRYDQIQRVDVRGGRISVVTSNPAILKFTFLPANTSYLSTGKSRKQALDIFAAEFSARLTS